MRMTKQELTEQTITVWQPRTPRRLSNEDAREIAENLSGFFAVLAEWSRNEGCPDPNAAIGCTNTADGGGRE